jgi:malonyl-CoA O-methyltransferase
MSDSVPAPTSNKGPRPQDLDEAALRHQARRVAKAEQPPWLHAEAAQRMAERLPFIKLQPARLLDASPALGASADLLRLAYPKAEMLWHEADPALAQRAAGARSLGWWQKLRGTGSGQVDALPVKPEVELLWSNMALHASADLPEQLSAWQASLGGFVSGAAGTAVQQRFGAIRQARQRTIGTAAIAVALVVITAVALAV